ncbi:MAG: glycosyltransferase family 39 protein [Planctomycetota bacterium]
MSTRGIKEMLETTRGRVAGLVLLCLVLFFFCLGSNRALTAHEVLMAGTAKQMAVSGNWIVPTIGDHTWLEKPPLPQWLAGMCAMLLGGFNEWTMRLPFAVSGVVVVLLTVRLMTTLFDARIGWLSGLIQATTVYMVMYARLAESDMLLLVFVLAAITVFQEVETRFTTMTASELQRCRLAFWVLLGLTNLAKGVAFGAVLIVFTCGGWILLRRDWQAIRRWWSPLGILLGAAVAVAWPVAVVLHDPEALDLWKRHLFDRAAGTLGYTQPPWYYLVQWPLQMMPWTPFLVLAAPASFRAARQQAGSDRFCWWWFLGQMSLLSCSSGKHHHYLIYALPALSPIVAQGLILAANQLRDLSISWKRWTVGLPILAVGGLVGGIVLGALRQEWRIDSWVFLPLVSVGLVLLTWQLAQRQVVRSAACLLSLVVVGHLYAQVVVMPRCDTSAADKRFLAEVDRTVGRQEVLAACGSQEIAQHIFYLDRPVFAIWNPIDLPKVLPPSEQIFVIARGHAQTELASLGSVEQILQSTFTRRERTPQDRFTLFRVKPSPALAAK